MQVKAQSIINVQSRRERDKGPHGKEEETGHGARQNSAESRQSMPEEEGVLAELAGEDTGYQKAREARRQSSDSERRRETTVAGGVRY